MIKNQGLAHLADVANPVHYPVRRRGEVRRLVPNWVGIAWLEAEALEDTEILTTEEPSPTQAATKMGEGLAVQRSRRAVEMVDESVRERPLYVRPMFQVFNDTHESVIVHHGTRVRADKACADCYDFQYPGRDCPRHPVKRLIRGGPPGHPAYWEAVAATRRPEPVTPSVTAYYSDPGDLQAQDVIEAAIVGEREPEFTGIQVDLELGGTPAREGMRLPDEMWRNLVEAYARITDQAMMQSARQIEEEPGVVVEGVDQEGRPSRITWHVEAENERNAQRRRLRGYWTEG